jgi:hypothetical protein
MAGCVQTSGVVPLRLCSVLLLPCALLLDAGVIPIAHNSGGPRADIVVDLDCDEGSQRTGYLAETKDEYCSAIKTVRQTSERGACLQTHAHAMMLASLLTACHIFCARPHDASNKSAPAGVLNTAGGSLQHAA